MSDLLDEVYAWRVARNEASDLMSAWADGTASDETHRILGECDEGKARAYRSMQVRYYRRLAMDAERETRQAFQRALSAERSGQ